MPPQGSSPDVIRRLLQDASDIANAVDAGMPESSNSALARLTTHIGEAERALVAAATASTNGHGPAHDPIVQTPPVEALDAEEHVLGAMMMTPAAVKSALVELQGGHFYRESHKIIFEAMVALEAKASPIDHVTVCDYLERNALLDKVQALNGSMGGKARIHEIAAIVPAASNVVHYCKIVRRAALERRLQAAVKMEPRDAEAIAEAAAALTREEIAGDPRRALDGADWLANQPDGVPAVWGKNDQVIWAEGEPLMLYGPDGVGKTSVAQQVVLHLCGIRPDVLLGLPVRRMEKPVLYLACDRPRQARRSLYRMIPKEQHEELRERLLIWEGPLPFALHAQPRALLDFCQLHDAGAVVVDSLKDVAVELTKPDVALKVNQAFQWLNANGVELLILHHPRKDPAGQPLKPKTLEDVYGDRNFVAGMGSVVLLWGKGGDPIVEMHHLKQPAAEFGPTKIIHDHDAGTSVLYEFMTVAQILVDAGRPLSATAVASRLFGVTEPSKNEVEKTRRQLRKLVAEHSAVELKDEEGVLAFGVA